VPEVTQYTERILIVLNPDASIKGIAIDDLQLIDGVSVKQIQVAADAITDPNVKSLIDAMGLSVAAEVVSLRSQAITLQAEIDRLTALVPAPVADYMITTAAFVERLEAASPGVIDRLWSSDAKEAGRLAVTLFTWSERIDCRPGGRLEGYLNLIVQMGFMDAEDVQKVWV
jgi:hypothetical protein